MRNGYLIGAIDHAAPDDQNWKKQLDNAIKNTQLLEQQVTLFDPAGPWLLNGDFIHTAERRHFIERVNRTAMDVSDFAIVNLPKAIFSVGSIVEINEYSDNGKPIILATDIAFGQNVYLSNRVSPDFYFEYGKGVPALEVAALLLGGLVKLLKDHGTEDSPEYQVQQSHRYRARLRGMSGTKRAYGELDTVAGGSTKGSSY